MKILLDTHILLWTISNDQMCIRDRVYTHNSETAREVEECRLRHKTRCV